uniref:G-protein coupled receptors family 3 profile domain-containing protein n=1 Tax=Xenopus tropicalis TaxID=8364 RepID=A0A1B8Y7J5_XENTR
MLWAIYNPFPIFIYLFALRIRQPAAHPTNPACNLGMAKFIEDFEYIQDGDVIIGGLLTVNAYSMHLLRRNNNYNNKLTMCGGLQGRHYRQLVELRLAVEEINKNPSLLPNVTLGYHIYDSCGDPRKAVRSVLQILSGTREPVPNYSCGKKRKIVGFIGDLTSETTIISAQILSLFGFSQISYGASDPLLSDRVRFPYFFRTLQGFGGSALAISKILKHFGWTWVGIIRIHDSDRENEVHVLTDYLSRDGICVEFTHTLSPYLDAPSRDKEINRINDIVKKFTTDIIILCGKLSNDIMLALYKLNVQMLINKTFILSPSASVIGHNVKSIAATFDGSLMLTQYTVYPRETHELIELINAIHPSKDPTDKLLEDILLLICQCSSKDPYKNKLYGHLYKQNYSECEDKNITQCVLFVKSLVLGALSPHVHLAVTIMSRAVDEMHRSLSEKGRKAQRYQYQLHHYLKKYPYQTKYGGEVSFNGRGEMDTGYTIYFFPSVNDASYLGTLGRLIPSAPSGYKLIIHPDEIPWEMKNKTMPRAQCTDACQPGYRKALEPGAQPCCYHCVRCSEGEISNQTDSDNCLKCPDVEWPNEQRNQCIAKTEEFLSFTDCTIAAFLSSVTILFYIITLLILGIFITFRDSPIVRANNRSLSFLLLVSIKLSFLSVFLFLGRPVDITCMLRIITFGITFSIAVSSLLAKTIMVCVAFKATKPGSSWRKWLGVKLSNSVVLFCSSIQIIICMTWLAISPPFQELDIHTSPGTIIIQCNEGSAIGFYSVIGYMGLLAAVSFVLAFLARSLPDSFNEAKYITFSMLLFCSVWITMIPAYLSTKGKNTVCVEIFAILTSSAGLLACIFLPKCYVIMFEPETNQKLCLLRSKTL